MCCDLRMEMPITPDVKGYRMTAQVVRDAVVATVAWRVVIASVDTAYGARLVGYVLVPTHRVFFFYTATRGGA